MDTGIAPALPRPHLGTEPVSGSACRIGQGAHRAELICSGIRPWRIMACPSGCASQRHSTFPDTNAAGRGEHPKMTFPAATTGGHTQVGQERRDGLSAKVTSKCDASQAGVGFRKPTFGRVQPLDSLALPVSHDDMLMPLIGRSRLEGPSR